MRNRYLNTKVYVNNLVYKAYVTEDIVLPQISDKVGVFGWAIDPNTFEKLGFAMDWPATGAPSFKEQCKYVLDNFKRQKELNI